MIMKASFNLIDRLKCIEEKILFFCIFRSFFFEKKYTFKFEGDKRSN